jgi:hypothetical protein
MSNARHRGLNLIAKAIRKMKISAKFILITTVAMSFAVVLCLWKSSSVSSLLVAGIGGLYVILGLWIEKDADEDKEKFPSKFAVAKRLVKCRSKIGWWILIVGIGIEIADAGWTAHEINETNKAQHDADPRNLPINSISGYAIVEVRAKGDRETNLAKNLHQILADRNGINFDLTTSTKLQQNPESVLLDFGEFPAESPAQLTHSVAVVWQD